MALIKTLHNIKPVFGKNCWFADNATIIGEVIMGNKCSVWFNTVLRGDVNSIHIGNKVNIQDGAVIHGTYKKAKTVIGDRVSIGHNAIVHGCQVEDNVLIGMGSVVMDNACISSNCIIAAGAVILAGTKTEPGFVYAGVPAKKVKKISESDAGIFDRTADNYVMYASWYK